MVELVCACRWLRFLWLARGPAPAREAHLADLRGLLERARYDLEKGWPEAAYDALGRALRLLGAP